MEPLIRVEGLRKTYLTNNSLIARALGTVRQVHAVDEVDLEIRRGETLGVVGESGCGKSTLARCLMLLERPTAGSITSGGRNIVALRRGELRWFRQNTQMVFQDPQSSLNRSKTIFQILRNPLDIHSKVKGTEEARRRITELLQLVGLHAGFIDRYPHELSGGQRQRIGIARALAVEPEVLILDEPVSALDVSIQAQVINLLDRLQRDLKLTYVFISHDLNLVRYLSDRVAVMYLGRIVEIGDVDQVFERSAHPYTQLLLAAAPTLDPDQRGEDVEIIGEVPSPINPPSGCAFHPRCPHRFAPCDKIRPERLALEGGGEAACHLHDPEHTRKASSLG